MTFPSCFFMIIATTLIFGYPLIAEEPIKKSTELLWRDITAVNPGITATPSSLSLDAAGSLTLYSGAISIMPSNNDAEKLDAITPSSLSLDAAGSLILYSGTISIMPGNNDAEKLNGTIQVVKPVTLEMGCTFTASTQPMENTFGSTVFIGRPQFLVSDRFFREDPEYAKNLPIRHFILSESQMAHFFSNSPPQPEPLNFYDFSESNLYLILQIKNIGPRPAYGLLHFPFLGKPFSIAVDLLIPEMPDFSTYVIPLGKEDCEDFEDSEEVREILDGLMWDKLSVGLPAEEWLEQWEKFLDENQQQWETVFEKISDEEEPSHFFPIFKSPE